MHTFLSALLLTAVALISISPASAGDDISVAEQRIFLDPHLQNIRSAGTVTYRFVQKGGDKDSYADSVTLSVGAGPADKRELKVDFLSGRRKLALSSIEGGMGNPVILHFLEHDIRDMHDRLGGQEAYFRKRIRMALANTATVKPVKLKLNGKSIDGQEVSISPYSDDPLKERLKQFVLKTYVFVVSDAVPGGVYALLTHVDATATSPPLDTALTIEDSVD